MKIESIIKRDGGTRVHFGEESDPIAVYHFAPDASGAHVADVDNDDHAETLLAIREGYRIARTAPADSMKAKVPVPVAPAAPTKQDEPIDPLQADDDKGAEADEAGKDVDLEALDRDALAGLFEQKIGVRPPQTLSKAKIIEALRAANKA